MTLFGRSWHLATDTACPLCFRCWCNGRHCGFVKILRDSTERKVAEERAIQHKEEVEALLSRHVAELLPAGDGRAAGLARQLAFLLEGAMARAGLEGNDACLKECRTIAARLLADV